MKYQDTRVVQQDIKFTLNLARLEVRVACGSDLGSMGRHVMNKHDQCCCEGFAET